jgi:hypothetical protein
MTDDGWTGRNDGRDGHGLDWIGLARVRLGHIGVDGFWLCYRRSSMGGREGGRKEITVRSYIPTTIYFLSRESRLRVWLLKFG